MLLVEQESAGRDLIRARERIAAVRQFRERSTSPGPQALARTPTRFHVTVVTGRSFPVISGKREYVPIGWLTPPTIPSNLVRVLRDAGLWHFGILTSAMHMAWLRQVGRRLEGRYRYSIGIVYNPFPWPEPADKQRASMLLLAQAVLDARAEFHHATLADLYDADAMPPAAPLWPLRETHRPLVAAAAAPGNGRPQRQ